MCNKGTVFYIWLFSALLDRCSEDWQESGGGDMWKKATGQTRTWAGCSQPCSIWSPAHSTEPNLRSYNGNLKEFHWWAPKISVTSSEPDKMWSQCVPFCSWVENLKIASKVFLQKIMMLHEADLWPFGFKTGIRIMILSYCTICVKFLHNWMVHEVTVTFQEKEHFTSKSKFLFFGRDIPILILE